MDALRTNCAMVWMLVPMVEVLFSYEGGLGRMIVDQNKHMNLDAVYGITLVVLCAGLLQDIIISQTRSILCPFSEPEVTAR